ncbi:MAG: ParB/RepB/Spo0J family partition protein [Kiritimatiellae bacterium]|nr:ParB/RepB/Spo0J family partition protein [Kiritimatiellia bacterium]
MNKPGNLGRGLGDLFDEASYARTILPAFEEGFAQLPAASIRLPDWMADRLRNTPALDDLADSIRDRGILQPLLVRKTDDAYEIISGARRYAAAIRHGRQEIPALILKATDEQLLDIYLQENLHILRPSLNEDTPESAAICSRFNISRDELLARIAAITPNQAAAENTEPNPEEEEALADAHEPSLFDPTPRETQPREDRRPSDNIEETPYKKAFYFTLAGLCGALVLALIAFSGRRIEQVMVERPATDVATPDSEPAPLNMQTSTASTTDSEATAPRASAIHPALMEDSPDKRLLPAKMMNALRHPGLTIRPGAFLTEIIFKEPVFSYHSEINAEAEALLRFIGNTLQPWIDQIQIRVIGHTDNNAITAGTYHDNVDLGLRRASAAVDFLHREGHIPANRLAAASIGELSPPYPNDTLENKTKNRTITIQITR